MDTQTDFSELPNEIYEKALQEIISTQLKDCKNYEIKCGAGSKKGDNMLGIIYRISVNCKSDSNLNLNLILKTSPQNIARREQYLTHEIFGKESQFYREIYPMFKEFQVGKGIDVDGGEGFNHVATWYKSLDEEPFEGQFFHDLSKSGYVMHDRFKDLSKAHVILVMKALAKMHATFFCIKDQQPELIEEYTKMEDFLIKIFKVENSSNLVWLLEQKLQAMAALKNCTNQDLIDRVHKVMKSDSIQQFEECLSGLDAEPFAVLCHGDCWNNNLLYKIDEEGVPSDIKFLDFQFMRYASPATDLGYYIFGCTTKALRDAHYHEFLDAYHQTLSEFIKRLGSDPEKIFPRHALDDHMKKFAKFGILMGVMLIAAYISEVSDVPDVDEITSKFKEAQSDASKEFDKSKFTFISDKTALLYERRVMDVFEDMYNLGYI